jgi:hypothetical protein
VSTPATDSTLGWELAPQIGMPAPNPQRPSGQSRPQLPAANTMSAPAASRLATITLNGCAGLSE